MCFNTRVILLEFGGQADPEEDVIAVGIIHSGGLDVVAEESDIVQAGGNNPAFSLDRQRQGKVKIGHFTLM